MAQDEEITTKITSSSSPIDLDEQKKPVLDKLVFVSGLGLDTSAVIGEKIVGEESRAIGQIIEKSSNAIGFVYLNANRFIENESVTFKESSINANIQQIINGNFVDRTNN